MVNVMNHLVIFFKCLFVYYNKLLDRTLFVSHCENIMIIMYNSTFQMGFIIINYDMIRIERTCQ